MRVIVMGAGVVGVTTAWYLHQAGHEVTVLERNRGAACETSFGNGGQISVMPAIGTYLIQSRSLQNLGCVE